MSDRPRNPDAPPENVILAHMMTLTSTLGSLMHGEPTPAHTVEHVLTDANAALWDVLHDDPARARAVQDIAIDQMLMASHVPAERMDEVRSAAREAYDREHHACGCHACRLLGDRDE